MGRERTSSYELDCTLGEISGRTGCPANQTLEVCLKMQPALSVLLPVYNGEKYIVHTITAILYQTYSDFELIIIDDCSADRTYEIVARVRDARIKVERNSRNLGLSETLNIALRMARGKYIARADADDLYDNRRFEEQLAYLEAHPEVGIVGTDAWKIDHHNRIIGTTFNFAFDPVDIDIRLQSASPFFHSSVVFRRELVVNTGGYPKEFPDAEDTALWVRLQSLTLGANLRRRLTYYRIHGNSVTGRTATKRELESIRARRNLGADFKYLYPKWRTFPVERVVRERLWRACTQPSVLARIFLEYPLISTIQSIRIVSSVACTLIEIKLKQIRQRLGLSFPQRLRELGKRPKTSDRLN